MNQEIRGLSKQQLKSRGRTCTKIFQDVSCILQKQGYAAVDQEHLREKLGVSNGSFLSSFSSTKHDFILKNIERTPEYGS